MALSNEQKNQIKDYLVLKIREKLQNYNPETSSMPFHFRLLGKDKMALFSFIQSVNTTLGTSIFEKVGKIIAEPRNTKCFDRHDVEGFISSQSVVAIDSIMRNLRSATEKPNKEAEINEIEKVAKSGDLGKKIKRRADLFVTDKIGIEHYFELKTAKPNINEFTGIKKLLLDWVAIRKNEDPTVKIKTYVAIPYNPYEPKPYERWTLQGLFDLKNEVLVGKEFWDYLGGNGTYEDLLKVFEQAGLDLRKEIDDKINSLK